MEATRKYAQKLTEVGEGKHHIGDFLPSHELPRFLSTFNMLENGKEPEKTDYQEFKLQVENIGFRMLLKMGWKDGSGLGKQEHGYVEPISVISREPRSGLRSKEDRDDDQYSMYRKRMMLAYKFRPNPLNNPRRPYY
ncbi:hypothetical protein ACOME3_003594 [Neoechinorhynchus agilis]